MRLIEQYMNKNGITEQNTFFAVSPSSSYDEIISPNTWNHIWIKGGRSKKTASYLLDEFLNKL